MLRKVLVTAAATAAILAGSGAPVYEQTPVGLVKAPSAVARVAPAPADGKWDIAGWGDSLMQGVGSTAVTGIRPRLAELLGAAGVNYSLTIRPGMTLQKVMEKADSWLAEDNPDIVFLMIGTNNAAGACDPGEVCAGMTNYQATYRALANKVLAYNPNLVLVVATVPYANKNWSPNQVWVNQFAITEGAWNPTGAGRVGIAYMNHLHRCNFPDKIHPEDLGWRYMAEKWYEETRKFTAWPDVPFNHAKTILRPGFETTAEIDCR